MERQCEELLGKVRTTAAGLRDACDTIEALRGRVVGLREALATELNAELNGVQLKVLRFAGIGMPGLAFKIAMEQRVLN